MTAIVKAEMGLDTTGNVQWTRERVDLLKKTVCPKGITDDEFALFLEQCKATGMNPFIKEAFCVPRRTNVGTRDNPKWITQHVFQSSVDGMLSRAARFGDFERGICQAIYANDPVCKITESGVVHEFDPRKPRGAFAGSWAMVERKGAKPTVVFLAPSARTGKSDFWSADPGGMHAKCALAAALRKAYPSAFAGIYAAEEAPAGEGEPTRAEEVGEALKRAEVTVEAPPAKALPAGPVVEFGEWKGREVASLSLEEARAAEAFAVAKLEENPKAKWRGTMERSLADVRRRIGEIALSTLAPVDDAEPVYTPEGDREPTEAELAADAAKRGQS